MLNKNLTITQEKFNQVIYSGGHIVGIVRGETLTKSVFGSRHFLRTPPAIAIGVDVLTSAEQAGAVDISVVDQETGILYRSTIEHFRECAFPLDRGYGPLLALALEGWTRSRKNGGLSQLALFGGNDGIR